MVDGSTFVDYEMWIPTEYEPGRLTVFRVVQIGQAEKDVID